MEQRLNRIEEMLATLINMVGSMHEEQTLMKQEQNSMKEDLTAMKEEQSSMKKDLTAMKEEQSSMKKDLTAMKEEQSSMKKDLTAMKEELTSMREDLNVMRSDNEQRHNEIISRFVTVEAEHEHTWEKTVRNEREIAKMKKQFEL